MKLLTLLAIAATIPILILCIPLDFEANEPTCLTDLIPRSDPGPSATSITTTEIAFKYNGTDITSILNTTLSAIIACPDSIITSGSNATRAWMKSHGYSTTAPTITLDGWWQDTKCALAIATFVDTNLVTATKLLKVKEYIEALGGVSEAAELLLRCSTWAERAAVGGTALVNLCAEILGVALIKDNCT